MSQMAFQGHMGWEIRIRIVLSMGFVYGTRGNTAELKLDLTFTQMLSRNFLSFDSMMLLAQALEALWDRFVSDLIQKL